MGGFGNMIGSFNKVTRKHLAGPGKKLLPGIRVAIRQKPFKNEGESFNENRLKKLAAITTNLFRDERVEGQFWQISDAREYIELLMRLAVKHGDRHIPTMEKMDFFVTDKVVIHKVFKELVPRYQDSVYSYTKMYKAPIDYQKEGVGDEPRAILELRNNILVPVNPRPIPSKNWINNILLEEARKEYNLEKQRRIEEQSLQQENES